MGREAKASVGLAIGVAGFDFHVRRHPAGEALQRGLLRIIQRASRDLGLKFRFRCTGEDLWGELDGSLRFMWALRAYLEEDFVTHAAAAAVPPDRRQRLRIARALLRAFDGGLWQITDAIHNEITPMLTDAGFDSVPNSVIFDYGPNRTWRARCARSRAC